jgi:hypothetical protein
MQAKSAGHQNRGLDPIDTFTLRCACGSGVSS